MRIDSESSWQGVQTFDLEARGKALRTIQHRAAMKPTIVKPPTPGASPVLTRQPSPPPNVDKRPRNTTVVVSETNLEAPNHRIIICTGARSLNSEAF